MWKCCNMLQLCVIAVLGHLRHNGVGGDDVLHLLGPGVHEAEPSASQCDERAIFDLEFVTVGVDLLSHLQHCGHAHRHDRLKTGRHFEKLSQSHDPSTTLSRYLVCGTLPGGRCRPGGNTHKRRFRAAPGAGRLEWLWLWKDTQVREKRGVFNSCFSSSL